MNTVRMNKNHIKVNFTHRRTATRPRYGRGGSAGPGKYVNRTYPRRGRTVMYDIDHPISGSKPFTHQAYVSLCLKNSVFFI